MSARFATCAIFLLALIAAPITSATAQELDRVAAVINDEAISLREVDARVRAALLFANIPDSTDARRRVVPQVLRKMIDERLQMQEAIRLKISLSPAEIDNGIALLEQQNRMPKGALIGALRQAGIDIAAFRDQIRADLTWMRLTSRVLQGQVRIGEEEISDRLDVIKDRHGRPEFLASEIFLPIETPDQEEDARRLGERLLEQLRTGTNFGALARQFSRSPTAANNGSMGWVTEGAVDEEMQAILGKLGKGQISPLTRTSGGFHILAVVDQRIAGTTASPEDAEVTLASMILPVPKGAPPKQQLMANAAGLTGPAKNCGDFDAIGRRVAAETSRIGPIRVGELPPQHRRIAAELPVGKSGPPQDAAEGIQVIMVCARQDATKVMLPSREQARRMIEEERLDMLSRRYIRDLRRAAYVDSRI